MLFKNRENLSQINLYNLIYVETCQFIKKHGRTTALKDNGSTKCKGLHEKAAMTGLGMDNLLGTRNTES